LQDKNLAEHAETTGHSINVSKTKFMKMNNSKGLGNGRRSTLCVLRLNG
jgi:hypothetical protein